MITEKLSLPTRDNHVIPAYRWTRGRTKPKAVVLITHGMSEHAERYRWLAEQLTHAGYAVFAHDHRGHGQCIGQDVEGLYADEDGWNKVVNDITLVHAEARSTYPHLPIFLLAHSMGSFIAQAWVIRQGRHPDLAGLILSGSKLEQPLRIRALRTLVRIEKRRCGGRGVSPVIDKMTFGSYQHTVSNRRTEYDWLSRDSQQVDLYLADPWCGFDCKVQLWEDLADGLLALSQKKHFRKFPHQLPLYLFAGDRDPVGDMGKSVRDLANAYIHNGQMDVTCRLYPDGRHEMLNESNREQVTQHLLHWLQQRLDDALSVQG